MGGLAPASWLSERDAKVNKGILTTLLLGFLVFAVSGSERWAPGMIIGLLLAVIGPGLVTYHFKRATAQAASNREMFDMTVAETPALSRMRLEDQHSGDDPASLTVDRLDPPPTPEEMHEAEMHPWPGHSLIQTIRRNRGQV